MKNLLLALLILFPVSLFANTYDDMAKELIKKIPAKDKTKTIAVMPFSSDGKYTSEAGIATEEMTKALINLEVNVSERSQIDKLLKEQELTQAGVLTDENAGEIAQGLGAKYVVLGSIAEINKFGEHGNIGLKINVKLVTASNYKVIAAASGEASAGDASSKYKRQAPRKAAEYPQYLEIFGGGTFFKYNAEYANPPGGTKKVTLKTGISGGARLIQESKGFYTSGWEFLYSNQKFNNDDLNRKFENYQISWIPMIRIPLWTYMPSLPDYTSIHLGFAIGVGINDVAYVENAEQKSNKGFGLCTSAIAGLRIGISDSVSFFVDGRYAPEKVNGFLRSQRVQGIDSVTITESITGPSVYVGISLAP